MLTRQDAKYRLRKVLDEHLSDDVTTIVFSTTETVEIADGHRGIYVLSEHTQTPVSSGFDGPRAKILGATLSCYGKDEESADAMYEDFKALVETNPVEKFRFTDLVPDPLFDDQTRTYIVRCTFGLTYVN